MASAKTLNIKNLVTLGADRLAELLMDLAEGDAAMKRRLRLELASQSGGADVAAEIRRRLSSIARSQSFVDWQKVKLLAQDLETQRSAIMAYVAPSHPTEAFELLWRMLDMAPSVYERCDDSNGTVGSVMGQALADIGIVASQVRHDPVQLAERVYEGVCSNDYGQFDGLIPLTAPALGSDGLGILKAKFESLGSKPSIAPIEDDRKIIGINSRGPVFQHDYASPRHAQLVQGALADIADALGDVDSYVLLHSEEERANPAIAARIAERLLAAGRPAEALAALERAAPSNRTGGRWPEWQRVRIDALESSGLLEDAQRERWKVFEQSLNPDYLKAFIKRLPDFDDMEAESRALKYAREFPNFHQALSFLIEWPAQGHAAELILARHTELDGDHYWLLTPAADKLEQRHPLAATLLLRAMIGFALDKARFKRYPHAARHLQTCEHLARKIDVFGEHDDHNAYVASLKARHGRKSGFWNA